MRCSTCNLPIPSSDRSIEYVAQCQCRICRKKGTQDASVTLSTNDRTSDSHGDNARPKILRGQLGAIKMSNHGWRLVITP